MILAEGLHILTLDDRGVKSTFADLNTGSVGAVLLDLALAERIDLVDKRVAVTDPSPTGHPLLDSIMADMAVDKPRTPQAWTSKLTWGLSRRVMDTMVQRGLVGLEKRTILGLFPSTRHPLASPSVRAGIRHRLASSAAQGRATDIDTACLAGLLHALNMEKHALPDLPRGQARKALKTIADDTRAGDTARQVIKATQTAVIAAVTAAVVATTVTTGGGS